MWTCPDCGRLFANTNQAHACQDTSEIDYLAGKSEHSVSVYDEVVSALRNAGEFRLHAQKSRIAFISKMTFAGISLAREWADLAFILPEPLDSPRNRKLELYGPTSWGHSVRLRSVEEVDSELRSWLSDALRRGDQETLDPGREVRPLKRSQLDIFWTGFRGRVSGDRVRLPGYVSEALVLVDLVETKVAGESRLVGLDRDGTEAYIALDPGIGLGEGEQIDVFLRASS